MTEIAESTVAHKRATVRPDKGESVAELTESFSSSTAAVLTEYRGLTVKQLKELRRALGADASYAVVKNTLTKIAATNAGLSGLDELLAGPTAVAFVKGDPVLAAKGLRDFARTNPQLVVKGGVMEGRTLSADDVRKLADLESREVLLAKLAGAMKGSLQQAVSLFAAPLAQAARALGALESKAQEDPSVLAGGAGTPAPAAPAEETADSTTETGAEGATETSTDSTAGPDAEVVAEAPAEESAAQDSAAASEETE